MSVKAIPDGYPVVSPSMNVKNAGDAIAWLVRVFGAKERMRMHGPAGLIMHAEVEIGGSVIMFSEAARDPVANIHACIYVEDCDATIAKALAAGATTKMPAEDMFWGDRAGAVVDPFGNQWYIATHKEDVTPEQMAERMKAMGAPR